MRKSIVKGLLLFNVIFSGVASMEASHPLMDKEWVTVKDSQEHLEVRFPLQPSHLSFDLPLESSDQLGHLEVFSTPAYHGLFMLSSLYSPLFVGKELHPEEFRKLFYTFIIKRMFYSPKVFKHIKNFEHSKTTFEGLPAMSFSFSYQDNQVPRKLSGLAVLKDKKLYTLFYLAAEDHFDVGVLRKFIDSLHFTDNYLDN